MITAEVAREIAVPYTDQVVFPETVMIDLPESVDRRFPGWAGPVLVLSVENQGVCAWGVPLGGENPEVLVGGDIKNAGGWARGTTRYCRDAAEFAATRRWDESCFSQGPLLQAQAAELDDVTLNALQRRYAPRPATSGWPGHTVHRWERSGAMIMLWESRRQCDWFISAQTVTALQEEAAAVLPLSDLRTSLWSDDPEGVDVLRQVRQVG
ncbi:hypothetical protein [Actinoplanes philippinensis]|uniref:hypothetical protein n=1 Tax=Actinoplanes philippinensis TaxID=35752 RepID=UPI00340F33FC